MNTPSQRRPIRAFHSTVSRLTSQRGFSRETQLPKLIGLWPSELRDGSVEAAERVVALLRKAIRGERRRGQSGHWTYDLNRHLALSEALKAEELRLAGLKKAHSCAESHIRRPKLSDESAASPAEQDREGVPPPEVR